MYEDATEINSKTISIYANSFTIIKLPSNQFNSEEIPFIIMRQCLSSLRTSLLIRKLRMPIREYCTIGVYYPIPPIHITTPSPNRRPKSEEGHRVQCCQKWRLRVREDRNVGGYRVGVGEGSSWPGYNRWRRPSTLTSRHGQRLRQHSLE